MFRVVTHLHLRLIRVHSLYFSQYLCFSHYISLTSSHIYIFGSPEYITIADLILLFFFNWRSEWNSSPMSIIDLIEYPIGEDDPLSFEYLIREENHLPIFVVDALVWPIILFITSTTTIYGRGEDPGTKAFRFVCVDLMQVGTDVNNDHSFTHTPLMIWRIS